MRMRKNRLYTETNFVANCCMYYCIVISFLRLHNTVSDTRMRNFFFFFRGSVCGTSNGLNTHSDMKFVWVARQSCRYTPALLSYFQCITLGAASSYIHVQIACYHIFFRVALLMTFPEFTAASLVQFGDESYGHAAIPYTAELRVQHRYITGTSLDVLTVIQINACTQLLL